MDLCKAELLFDEIHFIDQKKKEKKENERLYSSFKQVSYTTKYELTAYFSKLYK